MVKGLLRFIRIISGRDTDTEQEPNRLEQFAHFCVLTGKSFGRNRCPVRAAALSYATLLALIPMLAVAISVTSSLLKKEGEDKIYGFIDQLVYSVVPPASRNGNVHATKNAYSATGINDFINAESTTNSAAENFARFEPLIDDDSRVAGAQKEAAKRIHEFIQKTQSGALGVIGMLLLVFVAIRMLANIEETFNDIWGVTQGRTWLSRIILYWTAITLGPLLLVGALGLASSPHFQATKGAVSGMPVIGGLIFQLLPFFVSWLVFALIYQLVPHTKIHFKAALVGGIVGGTLWHLNNVFGFLFVSRLMSNSKIYGSLFLLPVFMAGIYFSWLILLFGAQVAYAFQNRQAYLQDKLVENVNQRGREFIALRLMTCIGQRFLKTIFRPSPCRQSPPNSAFPHDWRNRFCAHCSPRALSWKPVAAKPPTHPRARSRRSPRTTFSMRCGRVAGRNCPCATAPCAPKFWENSPGLKKPNMLPPRPSPCRRSSAARRTNWKLPCPSK